MIKIGKIVGSFGIKGELKVYPYTNDIDMLLKFKELYIDNKEEFSKIKIAGSRKHKNIILIMVEGIRNIEDSLTLLEKNIYIEESSLPSLEEGESYVYQLLSSKVYDEEGNYLGVVEDVFSAGAHDIYSVISAEGKEILIPVIPGVIVSKDMENKKIVVRILPGLLD